MDINVAFHAEIVVALGAAVPRGGGHRVVNATDANLGAQGVKLGHMSAILVQGALTPTVGNGLAQPEQSGSNTSSSASVCASSTVIVP